MFSLITGLKPPNYSSLPIDSEGSKEELKKRIILFSDYVKDLGKRAGMDKEILDRLQVCPMHRVVLASAMSSHTDVAIGVSLHLFFDIFNDFEVKDIRDFDLKIKDDEWVFNTFNAMYKALPKVAFMKEVVADRADIPQMRTCLEGLCDLLKKDKEKVVNGDRFTILHELGHVQNGNDYSHIFSKMVRFCLTASAASAAVTGLLSLLFPSAPVVTIGSVGLLVSAITGIIYQYKKMGKIRELRADHFAAVALNGEEGAKIREGGVFLFQEVFPRIWPELGDGSSDNIHPSNQERIKQIQALNS